jgi:fatty acid desaturase
MENYHDAEDGRAELSSGERASSPRLRRGTLLLITALLLGVLAGTIGLWCWVVWWGVTKLIGLMF